jgi:NitT/TauT family transport system substrate-binding protein
VIATYIQKTVGALISFKETGINKPEDIIGKTVASSPGSSSEKLFNAFLRSNNIPADKIKIQSVSSHAKEAVLLQGQVDATTGFVTGDCVETALRSSKPVSCMHFADYGVKALAAALLVNDDTLNSRSDLVRRFVKASNKGWEESIKAPAEAAKIAKKYFPLANERVLQAQFEAVAPLMQTDATKGKPIGWMAESDWEGTLNTLKDLSGLKTNEPATAFYTNKYIPEK